MTVTPPTLPLSFSSWLLAGLSHSGLCTNVYISEDLCRTRCWLTEPLGFGRTQVKNHCSITLLDQQSLSVFDETSSSITSLDQANQPCSTIQALRGYLSLTRPGPSSITSLDQQSLSVFDETSSSITSLDQANQPCSTIQALRGYLSLTRPGPSSITSLDQQ